MKLLLSTISLDAEEGGGTAQRTAALARHLSGLGVSCVVVAMQDGDLGGELRRTGVEVHATGFLRAPYHLPLANPIGLARLVRQMDGLHVLGYWNLLSVLLSRLARHYRRPYLLSAAGEFAALKSGGVVKQSFHHLVGGSMIEGARALIAITELERQQILEMLRVDPQKVIVVPNGVERPLCEVCKDPKLPDRPYVLFMGRLAVVKGPDLLLEAFARLSSELPAVSLVFAGPDGGLAKSLHERASALGLASRVVFTGFVNATERAAAYQGALMLAVPSRDEAMSLVALEAGASGKPVLLTDRCGFDAVEAVGGGRVVPANVEGLTSGMRELFTRSEELEAMGSRLRSYVEANYDWTAIAGLLLGCMTGPPHR